MGTLVIRSYYFVRRIISSALKETITQQIQSSQFRLALQPRGNDTGDLNNKNGFIYPQAAATIAHQAPSKAEVESTESPH